MIRQSSSRYSLTPRRLAGWPTLPVIASLLLLSCTHSDTDVAAIRQVHETMKRSALTGDWESALVLYSDSAALLPPGAAAVRGIEAIRQLFNPPPPALIAGDTELHEIRVAGDLGYLYGSYWKTVRSADSSYTERGKMLEILVRESDGQWRLFRDSWNLDGPSEVP